MRLTAEQLKPSILHADQDVREAVVSYFADSFTADDSILPMVIEAIEQFGQESAFPYYSFLADLPVSEGALPWVLEQLRQSSDHQYTHSLISCLLSADPSLLEGHKDKILDLDCLEAEDRDALDERIWFPTRLDGELWLELEEFCVSQAEEGDFDNEDVRFAHRLVSAIAEHRERYAGRVLNILSAEVDPSDGPMTWMEPFAVRLAGEMRLHEAVPMIINKLYADDDFLNHECHWALVQIGTDDVVGALSTEFLTADESFQFAVCHILESIHTNLSVSKSLELVQYGRDTMVKAYMLSAALLNFADEAIEPARQFVLNTPLDPDVLDTRLSLIVASELLGVTFPEQEEWKEARKDDQEFRKQWHADRSAKLAEMDLDDLLDDEEDFIDDDPLETTTIHNLGPKVGRNDPCPCGSGKKYKKCCYGKGLRLG